MLLIGRGLIQRKKVCADEENLFRMYSVLRVSISFDTYKLNNYFDFFNIIRYLRIMFFVLCKFEILTIYFQNTML